MASSNIVELLKTQQQQDLLHGFDILQEEKLIKDTFLEVINQKEDDIDETKKIMEELKEKDEKVDEEILEKEKENFDEFLENLEMKDFFKDKDGNNMDKQSEEYKRRLKVAKKYFFNKIRRSKIIR